MATEAGPAAEVSPTPPLVVVRRAFRWRVVASVLRVVIVTGTLLTLYAVVPVGERPVGRIAVQLSAALLVLVLVLAWQLWAVSRSPYPTLRGVEASAVSVSLLILMFAAAYFGTARASPSSFS